MQAEKKCEIIIKALDSKKGLDIKLIKVALAEEAEFQLSQAGVEPHHIEGKSTGWILLDYGDVVVHVLNEQSRSFYDLEHLWADGEQLDITGIIGE